MIISEEERYARIYNPFSRANDWTLMAVGNVSALLSVFGSLSIMYMIFKKGKLRSGGPQFIFHRIMWGMSVTDFLSSFAFILQPFMVPTFTQQFLAMGNTTTCSIAGFFSILSISSHMYSCALSIYFVCIIRYYWSVRKTSQILEPWIHIIAWSCPVGLGIASAALGVFNPRPLLGVCLTGHYPVDCDVNPDVPCERGGTIRTYLAWSFIGLSVVSGLVGIMCTWAVHRSVARQLRRSDRFSFRRSLQGTASQEVDRRISFQQLGERFASSFRSSSGDVTPQTGSSVAQRNLDRQDFNIRRRKAVAKQAVMYTLAFMNPFLVSLIGSVFVASWTSTLEQLNNLHEGKPTVFATVLVVDIFYSSQGFLNWIIYIHPTLARWKDAFPNRSLWWRYKQVISGKPTPTTRNTAHLEVQAEEPAKINRRAGKAEDVEESTERVVDNGSNQDVELITRENSGKQRHADESTA